MTLRILAAASPGEVRVAVADAATLLEFALWRPGAPDGVGDLYRCRITARLPALAGSFATLGADLDGFLPHSEGGEALREGEVFTARISRAAQAGKGPRLTARLCASELAGLPAAAPPGLVRRGPCAVQRLAAAYPDAAVLTDDPALAARLRPALGTRIAWQPGRLLDEALTAQIAALADSDIHLPGGMRMSITPTPALVAIDCDTGGTSAARETKRRHQVAANLALLPLLAREIRLRNLSGAILVDFAGLPARARRALGPPLEAALAQDRLRPRLLGFTALGLAEILRPRIHPPLHELLAGPHAAGLAALRALMAAARPGAWPRLCAAPAVVTALRADTVALAELAAQAGRALLLCEDRTLAPLGWRIEASALV
jgi:Ribonuclease G/E